MVRKEQMYICITLQHVVISFDLPPHVGTTKNNDMEQSGGSEIGGLYRTSDRLDMANVSANKVCNHINSLYSSS